MCNSAIKVDLVIFLLIRDGQSLQTTDIGWAQPQTGLTLAQDLL